MHEYAYDVIPRRQELRVILFQARVHEECDIAGFISVGFYHDDIQ